MHKSGDEVRVIARIKSLHCVFTFVLSSEEMDRICNCNISGLDILGKRETSCYVGKPAAYLGRPVRSFPDLSAAV